MQNLTFFFNSNVKVRKTSQIKKEYSQNYEKPFTKFKTYNQLKEYVDILDPLKRVFGVFGVHKKSVTILNYTLLQQNKKGVLLPLFVVLKISTKKPLQLVCKFLLYNLVVFRCLF